MLRVINALSVVAFVISGASVASARPVVTLKLTGYLVHKDANGAEQLAPLTSGSVHAGERIRWNIVSSNTGDSPAFRLTTPDAIPAHTAYAPNSARGAGKPEFSIDGGKSWSAKPMVAVRTKTGTVMKPADASAYTDVRFTNDTALAPKQTASSSFEVLVK